MRGVITNLCRTPVILAGQLFIMDHLDAAALWPHWQAASTTIGASIDGCITQRYTFVIILQVGFRHTTGLLVLQWKPAQQMSTHMVYTHDMCNTAQAQARARPLSPANTVLQGSFRLPYLALSTMPLLGAGRTTAATHAQWQAGHPHTAQQVHGTDNQQQLQLACTTAPMQQTSLPPSLT
jgi:hypothetical protein